MGDFQPDEMFDHYCKFLQIKLTGLPTKSNRKIVKCEIITCDLKEADDEDDAIIPRFMSARVERCHQNKNHQRGNKISFTNFHLFCSCIKL